jgi:NADH-quinone oxidoreductase subunit C
MSSPVTDTTTSTAGSAAPAASAPDGREALAATVQARFGERVRRIAAVAGELSFEVGTAELREVCRVLRDDEALSFEVLADLSGIDYLVYGHDEWQTNAATSTGFSRGVARDHPAVAPLPSDATGERVATRRFAVVYHRLSIRHNRRLRLRAFCKSGEPPLADSVVDVWPGANWYEREAFDLFGILFRGHPDLRRILTDYGFIGHPFRKDFPLSGHVEVRYDPEKQRVVYQPVSIEPRVLVPRVIRDDHRYDPALTGRAEPVPAAPAAVPAGKPNA